ncbi:MAG: homoserine kinase [Vampirovibrionales bacterium]|nr:homoserine kinase [Vampirovibrionales bacterium]
MTLRFRAPATSANLGPGFDSFGLALTLYNHFAFTLAERDAVVVSDASTVNTKGLSVAPQDNLAFQALDRLYAEWGRSRPPVTLEITAHIPLARGLGSSSTAIVAALAAGLELSGESASRCDLLRLASELEGHPDNVAPALLGGVTLCDGSAGRMRCYSLPWPDEWGLMAIAPSDRLLTEDGRQALPESYSREDAVFNLRKSSVFVYSLMRADPEAFADSLSDRLHQPYRGPLIRDFEPVRALARQAGAFGVVISGSGSSLLAFYPKNAESALTAALQAYQRDRGENLRILPLGLDTEGVQREI